ncbi:MAG: GNAT family N-acetyltransferase [Candidatus Paceibacterales bacterium]
MKKNINADKIPKMKIPSKSKKYSLRTKIIRRIEKIHMDEWNKVSHAPVEGGYSFLKTLDECHLGQFSLYYILVYKGKCLVGTAPCFTMNYPLDTSVRGPLFILLNSVKKIFPNIFSIKACVCGIPTGPGHIGIADDPQLILEAVLRRMEQIARKNHIHTLAFKDFSRSYEGLLDPLKKEKFLKIDSLPMTELPLDFSSFDDYMKILSGATRYDLRRKFKKASTAKIDLSILPSLDDEALDEAYCLYLEVVRAHEIIFEVLPKDFFKLIPRNLPGKTKFFLWRMDGKLVAFSFCLVSGEILHDYFVGLDYTWAYSHHLYFVKFKEVMEWCIAHGIKRYDMDRTGYEPKRRLGFNFMPLYLYVKIRHKILRPFFNGLCAFLKFENFDPELKRWKNQN